MTVIKIHLPSGREYKARFIIFDEVTQTIPKIKRNGKMQIRVWSNAEIANQWAAEHISSWVVMEQWQWVGDSPAYRMNWTVQKLH